MHSHIGSVVNGTAFFLYVVILGSLWRLLALHLVASSSTLAQKVGKVMLLQY